MPKLLLKSPNAKLRLMNPGGGSAAAAPAAEAAAAKDDEDAVGLSALGRSKRPQYKFVGELQRLSLHVPAPLRRPVLLAISPAPPSRPTSPSRTLRTTHHSHATLRCLAGCLREDHRQAIYAVGFYQEAHSGRRFFAAGQSIGALK